MTEPPSENIIQVANYLINVIILFTVISLVSNLIVLIAMCLSLRKEQFNFIRKSIFSLFLADAILAILWLCKWIMVYSHIFFRWTGISLDFVTAGVEFLMTYIFNVIMIMTANLAIAIYISTIQTNTDKGKKLGQTIIRFILQLS